MIQKRVITAVSVVAAAGLLLVGCANQSGGTSPSSSSNKVDIPTISSVDVPKDAVLPAGDGKATCDSSITIGYVGAETGANAALGINIYNGVQLAIDQHNKANPG